MSWYIRLFLAWAGMAGAVNSIWAQVTGFGCGNLLPAAYANSGYHAGSNQALHASEKLAYFSASHCSLYGIAGLSGSTIELAYPFQPGTMAFSCISSGFAHYRDYLTGLSFARAFGKKVRAGVQLDYLQSHAAEQAEILRAVSFEGGLVAEPVRNFYLAFHLVNPLQNRYAGSVYQHLPSLLRFAAGYRPGEKVLLITELEKDVQLSPVIKASVDFEPAEILLVRYGINSVQGHYLGFVITRRQAQLEAGLQRHPTLGYSVTGSFCWHFKSRRSI
ncbi:MAG: hypothetical protein U0T82_15800 [Bacteroidales bacterium]